jgi:SpoVK/Ycf46/Vps4 family AAA+-type ATPase
MMPEPGRPAVVGWSVLGGTAAVVLLVLWMMADHGASAEALTTSRKALKGLKGGEPIEARTAAEREAVAELRRTIDVLKKRTGFTVLPQFRAPADDQDEKLRQPGYFFKQRLVAVRDAVRRKSFNKSITFDESLGFDASDKVPLDSDAEFLLTMLQLTEKAANIVLDTPNPVTSFTFARISERNKPVETGPLSRPVLLREYPLELKVVGGLEDLLWILHRLSQVDGKVAGDYPLILQGLVIDSQNLTQRDEINQLTATFRIAGMQFLSDEERAKSAGLPPPSATDGAEPRERKPAPDDRFRPRA